MRCFIMSNGIRQSKRKKGQRYITDPLVALCAGCFWLIFKVLPLKVASKIGGKIGYLVGSVSNARNHIARLNLKTAFPEKTQRERDQILKDMWCHWGRFFAEMPHAKQLFLNAEFKGIELLQNYMKQNKAGFVCSAHLGNWEPAVSAPIVDNKYLNPVYRMANNPWLDKLMFQRRQGVLIPKGPQGAKKMIQVLRQGGFIVMLCDQKLREGIEVPFFGVLAKSPVAIATLAMKFKLPIIMARSIRRSTGRLYVEITQLDIDSALTSVNPEYEIMLKINQTIESWIRETPEQWLWIHRRFDKSFYNKNS